MELSQTQRQQITLWHASLLKQMQLLQNHRHSILSQVPILLALPLLGCNQECSNACLQAQLTDAGFSLLCLHAMRLQMMHTLLPGGLLLHADAPKAFCNQLQSEGTLPLMKVNMDASSAARRLEVGPSQIPPASSFQHAQT